MNSCLRVLTVVLLVTMVMISFGQEEFSADPADLDELISEEEAFSEEEMSLDEDHMVTSEDQLLPPALIEGDMMGMEDMETGEFVEEDEYAPELDELIEEDDAVPGPDLETELIELEMDRELEGTVAQVETEARDLITISLDDVPVQDVVRMFTRISGVNIVAGTNLQGNVTVSLQEVEWEPALRVILDSVDMTMVEKSPGIYSIMSKAEMASEPVTVDTIFLRFTTVSNVLPVARRMTVSTNASVSGYPAANAIIVQETAEQLGRIKKTLEKLDVPRKQVFIEAKFVELNDRAIKDLGINWSVLEGYTISANSIVGAYSETRTATRGTSANSGRSWSRSYVSTDSDVDTETDRELEQDAQGSVRGVWNMFSIVNGIPSISFMDNDFTGEVSGRNFTSIDGNQGSIEAVPVYERERVRTRGEQSQFQTLESMSRNVVDDVVTVTEEGFGAILSADDFALTLSALKQNSGVDVISNPRIIVASGEQATIHVGIQEPNIEAKPQGESGTAYVYGLSSQTPFHEVGVKVKVLPTVNTDERITLRMEPELSALLAPVTAGGDAQLSFPRIQTRKISTEFNLESGRTVAIGGLTRTSDEENVTKVPILGDIPIIGKYLFRHTHTDREQDEVIIFVTVGLASAETLTEVAGVPSGGRLIHRHLAREAMQAQRVQTTP